MRSSAPNSVKYFCQNCTPLINSLIERNRLNAEISKRYDMLQHSFLDFTNVVHNKFSKLERAIESISNALHITANQPSPFASGKHIDDVTSKNTSDLDLIFFDNSDARNRVHPLTKRVETNKPTCLGSNNTVQKTIATGAIPKTGSQVALPDFPFTQSANDVIPSVSSALPNASNQALHSEPAFHPEQDFSHLNEQFITSRKSYSAVLKSNQFASNKIVAATSVNENNKTKPPLNTKAKPIYGAKSSTRGNEFSQKNFI